MFEYLFVLPFDHLISKFHCRAEGVLPSSGTDSLWNAKYLHDSAFHPETGDKQNILGRMSFQVPGGMLITGILLAFYKSPIEIFLGQWLNQSFNALVNFTNRSGDTPLPNSVILSAYFAATSLATATSIGNLRSHPKYNYTCLHTIILVYLLVTYSYANDLYILFITCTAITDKSTVSSRFLLAAK